MIVRFAANLVSKQLKVSSCVKDYILFTCFIIAIDVIVSKINGNNYCTE